MTTVLTKPSRSARKAKGAGHSRRAEILAAAEEMFLACGYEGATIRKIADEVGVSSTALYMHFRDKSEILVEICEDAFAKLIAQNTGFAALRIEPVARVRLMLGAYMQFALDNPSAYQLVFSSTNHPLAEDQEANIRALGDRCYALFAGAVQEVAASGRLKGEVDASAQVLWAAAHGLVALLIARPRFAWEPEPLLTSLLLTSLFDGLVEARPS